jgi:ABC-type phosphate transport system substrate-binding protein
MPTNILSKALLVATLGCISTVSAFAEVVVITHPSNSAAVDKTSIKRIFLGKSGNFADGSSATPINQATSSSTRQSFDSEILGRSSSQISAYWSKLIFTGKGTPPKEVADDSAVIALVAADPSAVGYVDSASVNDSVKSTSVK